MTEIDIHTPIPKLQDYLNYLGWITSGAEKILAVEKPGEGNMNVVLRITTDQRCFILKQSRPYVQKYQQIMAPLDRIDVEHQFYRALRNKEISGHFPKVIDYSPTEHLMQLEDLGQCTDMAYIYDDKKISHDHFNKLMAIGNAVHTTEVPDGFPENNELRKLNHQHIFVLPFLEDNGFQLNDIQNGLQELSLVYKKDMALKNVVGQIGQAYLKKGTVLIHGDYYPGSWMTEKDNIYVIDPEFSFVGMAEFDLGVMAAHLIMATMDDGYLDLVTGQYHGSPNIKLTTQIAGIEIMRRLIGLAQLPLIRTIEEKDQLLRLAHKMILP